MSLRDELRSTWHDMETECAHPIALRFAIIGCALLGLVLAITYMSY